MQSNADRRLCFSDCGEGLHSDTDTKTKQTTEIQSSALLRSLAEREGFEPPEPRSSTVFKTAAIDHSATSPKDKSISFFLNHQIFFEIFLQLIHIYQIINTINLDIKSRISMPNYPIIAETIQQPRQQEGNIISYLSLSKTDKVNFSFMVLLGA